MEYRFSIRNLACEACAKVCAMTLKKIDGVESVDINETNGETGIRSRVPIDPERIRAALAEKGYTIVIS